MIVIGDAAHATSPASGQGASMAIEDAVELGRCLRDLPDPAAAFAAYEGLRRDRVERVVAQGARSSNSKAAGPVGRVMRDLLLPRMLRRAAGPAGRGSVAWLHHTTSTGPPPSPSPPARTQVVRPAHRFQLVREPPNLCASGWRRLCATPGGRGLGAGKPPTACSNACATRSTVASSKCLPMIIIPVGRPFDQAGRHVAGRVPGDVGDAGVGDHLQGAHDELLARARRGRG